MICFRFSFWFLPYLLIDQTNSNKSTTMCYSSAYKMFCLQLHHHLKFLNGETCLPCCCLQLSSLHHHLLHPIHCLITKWNNRCYWLCKPRGCTQKFWWFCKANIWEGIVANSQSVTAVLDISWRGHCKSFDIYAYSLT